MTASGFLTTAVAVDDATAARIAARIEKLSGESGVCWSRAVDPSIIGGFKARVGNYIYDMSVSSQLDRIAEKLNG